VQKFLIEVPHEAEATACARAVKILLESGSHFMTHAEFGCRDGDHRAWMIMEFESKDEAMSALPPVLRPKAHIVALNRFSIQELDKFLPSHGS
jgi:hypothetical protein